MEKPIRFVLLVTAAIWSCQEVAGGTRAGHELVARYGAENVDVEVRNEGGVISVDATIVDPSPESIDGGPLERHAREAAGIVARHVPLGEGGSVTIGFESREEEGIVRTTRASTFRFDASELPERDQ